MVYGVPSKNDPKVYFENIYGISTITENDKFEFYHEYNECQLELYNGIIENTSPLALLSKIYKKEMQVSSEIMKKIETNEIILNLHPTFRDIEELR